MITSPHNPKLKDLRRLARRREERFAAEGEDLLAAADAAGWPALERFVAAGSGLQGTEVEPELLARASALGSGTRAIGVFEQRWAAPVRAAVRRAVGRGRPGQRRHGDPRRARLRCEQRRAGPGLRRPVRPQGGARVDGRDLRRAARPGERRRASCRASASRWSRARASRWPRSAGASPRGDVTLLVGAERDGLPAEVVAACDRVAHIPIAGDSLNAAMAATIALYETSRVQRR